MSLSAILVSALPFLERILDRIPDPNARAEAREEFTLALMKIEAEQSKAQVELNKAEAQHSSMFVAGWRPFIGWVGGVALAWTYIMYPIMEWVARIQGYTGELPVLQTDALYQLVLAMLGIGAMRSFDKLRGTHTAEIAGTRPRIAENRSESLLKAGIQPTYNN